MYLCVVKLPVMYLCVVKVPVMYLCAVKVPDMYLCVGGIDFASFYYYSKMFKQKLQHNENRSN